MRGLKVEMIKRILLFLSVGYYLLIIYSFSAQPAKVSSAESTRITTAVYKVADCVAKKVPPSKGLNQKKFIDKFHTVIRKTAHFLNFLILALLAASYIRCFDKNMLFCFVFAVSFCVVAAMFDEFHQLFVSGRSGQIRDVLIDSSGAAVGAFFHTLVYEKKQREKRFFGGKNYEKG